VAYGVGRIAIERQIFNLLSRFALKMDRKQAKLEDLFS
jgi:hypothetical protein